MSFENLRTLCQSMSALADYSNCVDDDLILGPCAIESTEQVEACARAARAAGASHLRGGARKLRTRSSSFAGLGDQGFQQLREAADKFELQTVSEVTAKEELIQIDKYVDKPQIGARSMWNHSLIDAVTELKKPIVLKRGLGATTYDWLCTAERVLLRGCEVYLCERGSVSYDQAARNSIDLSVLVFLVTETQFNVWLDVSHSSGDSRIAHRLMSIGRCIGVNGIMAEIHPDPQAALCDGDQAIPIAWLSP